MEPIGLTLKNISENPFTEKISGELMIVHKCLGCGAISCNRLAGDDNPHVVTMVLDESIQRSRKGIQLLTQEDKQDVLTILYGTPHV